MEQMTRLERADDTVAEERSWHNVSSCLPQRQKLLPVFLLSVLSATIHVHFHARRHYNQRSLF